jgi:hypothetical protein
MLPFCRFTLPDAPPSAAVFTGAPEKKNRYVHIYATFVAGCQIFPFMQVYQQ